MVSRFPTEILQQVPSLVSRLRFGIVMQEDHSIAEKAGTFSETTKSVLTPFTSKRGHFSKWVQAELP
jgi:hypothetical protein